MSSQDLELVTGSMLAVIGVGAIVFPLVGTLTYLVFRERASQAATHPTVVPVVRPNRFPAPEVASPVAG